MRAPSHRIANCYGLVATAWILATILGCGGEAAEPVRTYDLSPGFWFDEALPSGAADLDLERRENLEALTGLDYASGYERAGAELGVTHWDAELASPDWNLYTFGIRSRGRPDGPERSGHPLVEPALRPRSECPTDADPKMRAWRLAALLSDGGLVAVHGGLGVVCVDRGSKLRWSPFGAEHHDVVARPEDGHAFVLTQTERVLPGTGRVHPVLDDAITELDTQAQIVRSVSLTEALMKSMWLPILRE